MKRALPLLILTLASCAASAPSPVRLREPEPREPEAFELSPLMGDRQMEAEAYRHSWFRAPIRPRCSGLMVLPIENLDVPPLRFSDSDFPPKTPDYGLYANPIR